MALVKYNNNSISSVTALDSIASGSLVLLATNNITSGVSSSSFTSSINSTYDTYIFKIINCHPATDAVDFQVNFRDGGSAFDATKTSTSWFSYNNENNSGANIFYDPADDLAQSTAYQRLNSSSSVGNGADESANGEMFLFSPSSDTFVKHFIARTNIYHSGNITVDSYTAGYCNVTTAIDGVDFQFSSGNIDSGIIKMYGLSKS